MVKCSNCHCEIEDSKIILHERFCIQNIKYCDICKEAIIKEEYDEHCLNHNKNSLEMKKEDSEEDRNSRSLQRVMSSKVACEFCGLFLGYSELEEHEEMCGARSTNCKICGKNLIFKNLENHIQSVHGINNSIYKEYDPELNNNFEPKNNLNQKNSNLIENKNLNELDLSKMTSEEQIQYALALSAQQYNSNLNKDNNSNKNSGKSKEMKDTAKKSSSGIDYDEIEDEYERQMYEEKMKNFGK